MESQLQEGRQKDKKGEDGRGSEPKSQTSKELGLNCWKGARNKWGGGGGGGGSQTSGEKMGINCWPPEVDIR